METRRHFILRGGVLAAAAALIGPAGSRAGEVKDSKPEEGPGKPATEISPPEDLMREHGVLARILLIYEELISRLNGGQEFPPDLLAQSAGLVRRFVEDYHEKLEENHVFPRFQKAGRHVDLVRVLYEQHQAGRRLTDRLKPLAGPSSLTGPAGQKQAALCLRQFIRMYRPHKAREDTVLFPAFRSVVSPGEFEKLGEAFEDQEEKLFGKNGFEKIVGEVGAIEKTLGIFDLSRFTPPA